MAAPVVRLRKYWVVWTYIANHGTIVIPEASSHADAARQVCRFFSEDFAKKGRCYVFDKEPLCFKNDCQIKFRE